MKDNTNSMAKHLSDVERLNQNALSMFQAMFEAINTDKESAVAVLEMLDGTKKTVTIPSNLHLKAEVNRLRDSLTNIASLGNSTDSTIVALDGRDNFRQIITTSFKKSVDAIKSSEFNIDENINVTQNPLIERLLSPLTSLKLTLPQRYINDKYVVVTKVIANDTTSIVDGDSYASVISKLQTAGIKYIIKKETIKTDSAVTRFFGSFDVLNIVDNQNDTFTCQLNKITYSDSTNTALNSRELDVNNKLVSGDGGTTFIVKSVSNTGTGIFATIAPTGGYTGLKAGVGTLEILDDTIQSKSVKIPIAGQDKFILFISSVGNTTDAEGVTSVAKKIDSTNFKVTSNNIEYIFDTYFATNILSIGNYLESVVKDNSIPRFLAAAIDAPVLNTDYFKVTQVNKHITNTATTSKILAYSADKNRIGSELSIINDRISALSNAISKGQYRSKTEKSKDETALEKIMNEKEQKQRLFNSTVENISSMSSFVDAPKATPKYKIQGFWPIVEPSSAITGDLQRVVQYNVRYKYVPTNSDVTNTSSINIDGQEGVISAWNEFKTVPLLKEFDATSESFKWANVKIGDGNVNNINQLEIPISYGESVVIQVQAISEAGYPGNPALSEWSNPIKKEFPAELAQDEQIKSIVESNQDDVVKVQVSKEFSSRGITTHVSKSFTEQERYFSHPAAEIASGEYTSEQKTISQAELNKALMLRIAKLEELLNRRNTAYSVEIVAPSGRTYPVNRLSTVNVFAGHYTDYVDVNQDFGNIVEVVFYLKLINRNATSADIPSISPGVLTQFTTNSLYTSASYAEVSTTIAKQQLNGQIAYIRSKDVSGSTDLYVQNTAQSDTMILPADIEAGAALASRNAIQFDGGSFTAVKIKSNAIGTSYVALSSSHPYYIASQAEPSNGVLAGAVADEFNRIKLFNSQLVQDTAQLDLTSNVQSQFNVNDKYVIGKNSTGSRLFMRVSDIQNMQVTSSDSSASVILHNGEENALMIPIVYQFRMTDALGRINGDSSLSTSASNIEYNKKLGIDLIVGNESFKFDLNVNAKFRHTTLSASNQQNNVIISSIDPSASSTPNII